MSAFRLLRTIALLMVLLAVAANHWLGLSRLADWERTLWLTIYPIAADADPATRHYADALVASDFADVETFLAREAARYGIELSDPVHVQIAPVGENQPPDAPQAGNPVAIGWWSLKMRIWAWRQDFGDGLPEPDVQMFVLYREGRAGVVLDRSVGVRKGRFGVVNAFAARGLASRNRVVIAHELLHVLGATDKYDPQTGEPDVPEGLADPSRTPLYPQARAEIMGGRIAESRARSRMPGSLDQCVVGPDTAREIGWVPEPG